MRAGLLLLSSSLVLRRKRASGAKSEQVDSEACLTINVLFELMFLPTLAHQL